MDAISTRSNAALSSLSIDQSRQYGKKPTLQQVGKSF
jgi:hypothetical protein